MSYVGIFTSIKHKKTRDIAKNVARKIKKMGYKVLMEEAVIREGKNLKKAKFVISLGGDGTILRTARQVSQFGVPILGVSLGTVGFLAEIELKNLNDSIKRIKSGKFKFDRRTMLSVKVKSKKGRIKNEMIALNELIIKSNEPHMFVIDGYENQIYMTTYRADGLIVSTPTGSTAYGLSAGGPLVGPKLKAVVITPICAHSLNARSLVLYDSDCLDFKIKAKYPEQSLFVNVDGKISVPIEEGELVEVTKSKIETKFIRFHEYSFFEALRTKLKWSGKI